LEIVGPGVAADCREQQDGLHVQEAGRCGRTLARMSPVRGRRDDMLIIRGVNLYPSEVERVLLGIEGIAPHYQLLLARPRARDELKVLCESAEPGSDRAALVERARRALREETGVGMELEVLEPGRVPRSDGLAVRALDRRRESRPGQSSPAAG
jgi:phenylacetate-CoA ligase